MDGWMHHKWQDVGRNGYLKYT